MISYRHLIIGRFMSNSFQPLRTRDSHIMRLIQFLRLTPVLAINLVLAGCGGTSIGTCLVLGGCIDGITSSNPGGSGGSTATAYFYNELTEFGVGTPDVTADLMQGSSPAVKLLGSVAYSTGTDAAATSISLATTSGALSSTSYTVTMSLVRTSDSLSLASNSLSLTASGKYTLVAEGDLGNTTPQLQAYRQSYSAVGSGEVRLRFINALSQLANTAPLDIGSNGANLVTGLSYGSASGYLTLSTSATSLGFDIQQAGSKLASPSCAVQPGQNYDAIIAYTNADATAIGLFCHPVSP